MNDLIMLSADIVAGKTEGDFSIRRDADPEALFDLFKPVRVSINGDTERGHFVLQSTNIAPDANQGLRHSFDLFSGPEYTVGRFSAKFSNVA